MKKSTYILIPLALLMFVLAGCGGQQAPTEKKEAKTGQQVITLKMADSFPVTHTINPVLTKFFIPAIEEKTQGRVKIEYYPAEQLGKLKDLLNLCSQGITDIAYVAPTFLSGQLPLNTVMALPGTYYTAIEGTKVYMSVVKGTVKEEFKKYNVRPLFVTTTEPFDVFTVKKPVNSLEDLKGLKLKSPGGMPYDQIIKAVGATPVVIPTPETYEAVQRGVVDGNVTGFMTTKSYRLNEVTKYATYSGCFGGYPVAYVVNENTWNKLPDDVKKVFEQVAEETSLKLGEAIEKAREEAVKDFEKQGMTVYRPSPEEQKKWSKSLNSVHQIWIEDMEKKGLPGKKVYDEFQKACKDVVK